MVYLIRSLYIRILLRAVSVLDLVARIHLQRDRYEYKKIDLIENNRFMSINMYIITTLVHFYPTLVIIYTQTHILKLTYSNSHTHTGFRKSTSARPS
jgi:hypothetical protein